MRRLTLTLTLTLLGCPAAPNPDDLVEPTDSEVDSEYVESDDIPTDTDTDTDVPVVPSPCLLTTPHGVFTQQGCVMGRATAKGEAFLGIPYAEPPVGDLRWRRPVPHGPWPVPRDATVVGPACPQSNGTQDGQLVGGDGEEDCLTLNVFRPEGAADLPVLFFVHGGGHVDGSGGQDLYAKDPLLADGAVVVTHNYRLGPLGFFSHPALSDEDPDGVSGNQGLRDSLLALRWVHENIESFGGDPDRVLVFGESAGGLSSCALWASPAANGLYAAVLTQSAPCTAVRRPMDGATTLLNEPGEAQGTRLAGVLGCEEASDPLVCLRDLSVETLLTTAPGRMGTLGEGEAYSIVIDGELLPRSFEDALAKGDLPNVPFYASANADEGSVLAAGVPVPTEAAYRLLLAPYSLATGRTVDLLVETWPASAYGGSYALAFQAFYGDFAFVCGTRRLLAATSAAGIVSQGLFFERARPITPTLGAYHGVELPFVFGTTPMIVPAERALATTLQALWRDLPDGAPEVEGVAWPAVGTGWLHVTADAEVSTLEDVRAERCDVLFGP